MNPKIAVLVMFVFILLGSLFLIFFAGYHFLNGFSLVLFLMIGLWLYSLQIKDSSIVDIFWGAGFAVVAWFYFLTDANFDFSDTRNLVIASLVSVWGGRLSLHIGQRNSGKPEDYRYQAFRQEAGKHYWWVSFFRVFFLQGVILWILSSIFLVAFQNSDATFAWTDWLGIGLWAVGLAFEAIGDRQLALFKKDPHNRGKVMQSGLWRYTRHPNYFGDAVVWWGFFCFVLVAKDGWQYFFCPIFMTFLLRFLSGVPMLEANLVKTKPEYEAYRKRTSAFFPFFPKK